MFIEFFDLSAILYISGRGTMSKLRIHVCLSVARQNELQLDKLQADFRDLYSVELSKI